MLYEFELGPNDIEATQNNCCVKSKGAIKLSIVTRWLKKFHSGCKNLDDQAKSGRSKTLDSKFMLQAIEASITKSIRQTLCLTILCGL